MARANVAALETQAAGVCNVATSRSMTLLELIEGIGQVYGERPDIEYLPPRDGNIQQSAANVSRMCKLLGLKTRVELVDGFKSLVPNGAFSRR